MDAGFMMHHSGLMNNLIQCTPSSMPFTIEMPKHCILRIDDIKAALAILYFPEKYQVEDGNIEAIIQVADFFDIPYLSRKCDDFLFEATKRVASPHGTLMKLIWYGEKEWGCLRRSLYLSDKFKLKRSWNQAKEVLTHSVEEVGRLLDHEDFTRISVNGRQDLLESCVRKHIINLRHSWR